MIILERLPSPGRVLDEKGSLAYSHLFHVNVIRFHRQPASLTQDRQTVKATTFSVSEETAFLRYGDATATTTVGITPTRRAVVRPAACY